MHERTCLGWMHSNLQNRIGNGLIQAAAAVHIHQQKHASFVKVTPYQKSIANSFNFVDLQSSSARTTGTESKTTYNTPEDFPAILFIFSVQTHHKNGWLVEGKATEPVRAAQCQLSILHHQIWPIGLQQGLLL